MQELIVVRHCVGRHGRGALRSQNATVTVTELARVFQIRVDDAANPDAWLELTVEVESANQSPAGRAAVA
jgi:hypothetical protein